MMRGRGDLGILRSMGIPTDVIRISTYAQVLLALLPALALLIGCSVLIYSVPATNALFPYMHLPQYLVLILTSVVLSLFIAKKYNKKMFSDSVRHTLKGGDKE
jgi:FtsH-binding integral membrane protein